MLKIKEMFAFVVEDAEGEGVIGFMNPENKQWIPLVGADMARVESLKPLAKGISKATKKPYKLLKFSTRELLEEYDPKEGK